MVASAAALTEELRDLLGIRTINTAQEHVDAFQAGDITFELGGQKVACKVRPKQREMLLKMAESVHNPSYGPFSPMQYTGTGSLVEEAFKQTYAVTEVVAKNPMLLRWLQREADKSSPLFRGGVLQADLLPEGWNTLNVAGIGQVPVKGVADDSLKEEFHNLRMSQISPMDNRVFRAVFDYGSGSRTAFLLRLLQQLIDFRVNNLKLSDSTRDDPIYSPEQPQLPPATEADLPKCEFVVFDMPKEVAQAVNDVETELPFRPFLNMSTAVNVVPSFIERRNLFAKRLNAENILKTLGRRGV